MIGAIIGAASLAAQVAVGCLQVAWGVTKIAAKVGKKLGKGGWKVYKRTKRLGKGVLSVIRKSRVITRDGLTSPALNKSHVFTKPPKVQSVISKSRQQSPVEHRKSNKTGTNKVTKSNIFKQKGK